MLPIKYSEVMNKIQGKLRFFLKKKNNWGHEILTRDEVVYNLHGREESV